MYIHTVLEASVSSEFAAEVGEQQDDSNDAACTSRGSSSCGQEAHQATCISRVAPKLSAQTQSPLHAIKANKYWHLSIILRGQNARVLISRIWLTIGMGNITLLVLVSVHLNH